MPTGWALSKVGTSGRQEGLRGSVLSHPDDVSVLLSCSETSTRLSIPVPSKGVPEEFWCCNETCPLNLADTCGRGDIVWLSEPACYLRT